MRCLPRFWCNTHRVPSSCGIFYAAHRVETTPNFWISDVSVAVESCLMCTKVYSLGNIFNNFKDHSLVYMQTNKQNKRNQQILHFPIALADKKEQTHWVSICLSLLISPSWFRSLTPSTVFFSLSSFTQLSLELIHNSFFSLLITQKQPKQFSSGGYQLILNPELNLTQLLSLAQLHMLSAMSGDVGLLLISQGWQYFV